MGAAITFTSLLTNFNSGLFCQTVLKDLPMRLIWIVVAVVFLCMSSGIRADSVSLIPFGDATISEPDPGNPLGSGTTLDVGTTGPNDGALRKRALLKFDVASSIPGNAIVTSAALTMTVVTVASSTNLWFSLHKLLPDWGESVVTWTNRLSEPSPWSAPGGAAPLDFSSSVFCRTSA